MITFPRLKTNAVLQYPAQRTTTFSTSILKFIDGSEQRFRQFQTPLRSWTVQLNELDEKELAQLEAFFVQQQGSYGTFTFVDPWDQRSYSHCCIDQPELVLRFLGQQSGSANFVIKENRG